MYASVKPTIYLSISSFICQFTYVSICLSIHSFIHPKILKSLGMRLYCKPCGVSLMNSKSVCLYLLIYSCVRPFIYLYAYSSTCSRLQSEVQIVLLYMYSMRTSYWELLYMMYMLTLSCTELKICGRAVNK